MTNLPVQPLSASDAERISNLVDLLEYDDKLLAIRDGHHVVIPVRSEEELREMAEQEYTMTAFDYAKAPVGSRDWVLFWQGYVACARAIQGGVK